ncbi:YlmC/YmxH family sporulation protein [Clostridium septicum]|uniref:YlmC/YmxH family sporulation protein n=1 Tax=Clostridium septicum TaxID=1504 RepID=A0ABY5AXH0_CLOSE|nr:YlmC/YmxH family sporulation protein [Clostridium septicum]MDU1314139.1 YlmC/YmxH family sporulation protein [Clostridium septicum]UEC19332.1 YlmC/YmxH family sporulation protein [Clostridium septicum]USR99715.1 YlmC/YmxH family sporulation protein [Clostridium septicum]WLF68230.1 YlmC/YmxH family sporulation protein [Clostridium septicum]
MNFIDDMVNEENTNDNIEDDLILHSLNALRSMEVIDIKNGVKLGFVKDVVIDIKESKIVSIILPSMDKNWFSKEDDIEVPWENVKKAGMDVLLIDTTDIIKDNFKNNI